MAIQRAKISFDEEMYGEDAKPHNNQVLCKKCGARGYWKHEYCNAHTPNCRYCKNRIVGYTGVDYHRTCRTKFRAKELADSTEFTIKRGDRRFYDR